MHDDGTYSSAAHHSVTILPSFHHPSPSLSPSFSISPRRLFCSAKRKLRIMLVQRGGRCNETNWKRVEPGRCCWIVKYWPDWRAPTNDFFIERFRFDDDQRQRERVLPLFRYGLDLSILLYLTLFLPRPHGPSPSGRVLSSLPPSLPFVHVPCFFCYHPPRPTAVRASETFSFSSLLEASQSIATFPVYFFYRFAKQRHGSRFHFNILHERDGVFRRRVRRKFSERLRVRDNSSSRCLRLTRESVNRCICSSTRERYTLRTYC